MNKTQAAVMVALGAALGVGGKAVLSSGEAAPATPAVHAVDLRRGLDGSNPYVLVYAHTAQPDGGVKDVGQLKCSPTPKQINDCMNAIAATCQ